MPWKKKWIQIIQLEGTTNKAGCGRIYKETNINEEREKEKQFQITQVCHMNNCWIRFNLTYVGYRGLTWRLLNIIDWVNKGNNDYEKEWWNKWVWCMEGHGRELQHCQLTLASPRLAPRSSMFIQPASWWCAVPLPVLVLCCQEGQRVLPFPIQPLNVLMTRYCALVSVRVTCTLCYFFSSFPVFDTLTSEHVTLEWLNFYHGGDMFLAPASHHNMKDWILHVITFLTSTNTQNLNTRTNKYIHLLPELSHVGGTITSPPEKAELPSYQKLYHRHMNAAQTLAIDT